MAVERFRICLSDQKRKKESHHGAAKHWESFLAQLIDENVAKESRIEAQLHSVQEKLDHCDHSKRAKVLGAELGELTYELANIRRNIESCRYKSITRTEEYDETCAEFDFVLKKLKHNEDSARQAAAKGVEVKKLV